MARDGFDRTDPMRTIFALLGDRWSTLILSVLATGTLRQAPLRRVISLLSSEGDISQRMLTLKLRALQRNGLVARHQSADVPPRVDYALTPLGNSLTDELARLMDWIRAHRPDIEAARQRFATEADDG